MRGWPKRLFPPTAPPTALSQSAFQGSGRSPCEYGSSDSVPDSSSVGSQGSPDHAAGPICVDRVVVSACDVWVPLAALSGGLVEATCSPLLPADPASGGITTLGLVRTDAAGSAVGVTGLSLPVCPLVTTIMSCLSNSVIEVISLPDQTAQGARYRLNTGRVMASFDLSLSLILQSRHCAQGLRGLAQVGLGSLRCSASQVSPQVLSLLVLHPNIPDEPPTSASCGVRASLAVRVCGVWVALRSFLACCLGGFLARLRSRDPFGVLYSGALSERDVGHTPHGIAYCKSPSGQRVGSPAGQYLG